MIYYAPRLSCCPTAYRAARRANKALLKSGHTTIKTVEPYLEALFAVHESRIIGIACFHREAEDYYISIVFVEPKFRSTGVFQRLLKAVVAHARRNKAKNVTTEVNSKNPRMLEIMSRHWETSYVFFTKRL